MNTPTHERNFSTFELGDDPAKLAGGLIHEIADGVGIKLGPDPGPDDYGALIGALGTSKVLRENEPAIAWDNAQAAELVDASGIQHPLNRSLWTPDVSTPDSAPRLATGAVANWQDRTAHMLGQNVGEGELWLPVGNRVMDSPTEIGNRNVQTFYGAKGRYPTEAQYTVRYVAPRAMDDGYDKVHIEAHATKDGAAIAEAFAAAHPELFMRDKQLAVARVANAGVQLALQFRNAARKQLRGLDFDDDKRNPQLFILTDHLAPARTDAEANDPLHFQKPHNALRQVAVTAKLLREAQLELEQEK